MKFTTPLTICALISGNAFAVSPPAPHGPLPTERQLKRHGVGFGVYLSPWDRNGADYATPAYVKTYQAQLEELLTQYGTLFEVWHDGANGGDGWYGGAKEKRSIGRDYYEWPTNWALVRRLQPDAVIFSDIGPDIRWVGNESGESPYPNWARFLPVGRKNDTAAPGYCKTQVGSPDGKLWMPAETDVSIRQGWFWHDHGNTKVRPLGERKATKPVPCLLKAPWMSFTMALNSLPYSTCVVNFAAVVLTSPTLRLWNQK